MRKILVSIGFFIILFGCGEKQPIDEWKGPSGTKYKILKITKTHIPSHDMVMLKVQYLSSNIDNKDELFKEFRDIYPIIAMNIELDGYTHVGLEALPILLPRFGYAEYQTHRHNVPVKKLLDYREKVIKEKL